LQLARYIFTETCGAFDVSMGTDLEGLEMTPGSFTVCARGGGTQLDLGAIGKGYAVDRAADVLKDWDITHVLIDAGYSSVLALEPPSGSETWPLTISMPGKSGQPVLARIAARQRALGASGIQKRDHIRDPRTGAPVRSRQAAWVSAPQQVLADISRRAGVQPSPAAVADGLSTAFMIMSLEEIQQFCRQHPGVEAWILQPDLLHFGPN
jgi:thiamine biosynthesis lipoprotein